MAQWAEHQPANQKVVVSILSTGTRLSCRPGPQKGVSKRQQHIDVFLPLCLPPFPALKTNKSLKIYIDIVSERARGGHKTGWRSDCVRLHGGEVRNPEFLLVAIILLKIGGLMYPEYSTDYCEETAKEKTRQTRRHHPIKR